ncbi:hypothetical protein ACIBCB_12690 [Streptomyces uncialis]|uniref:hypothetical protein n=1 Tax=Streptomyces uncialis TaxID=1048205 RepID=UPI0037B07A11
MGGSGAFAVRGSVGALEVPAPRPAVRRGSASARLSVRGAERDLDADADKDEDPDPDGAGLGWVRARSWDGVRRSGEEG